MFRRALSLAAVIAALTASTAFAQSSTKLFKPGSLIIPQSAVFQTGCGSVSAYGLVYRLLLENQSGGVFGSATPVTIYWSIDPLKKSLNRCTPSNRHTAPGTSPGLWTTDWNDGCDFVVGPSTAGQQPVVQVNLAIPIPTGAPPIYPNGNLKSYNTTLPDVKAVPGYTTTTLDSAVTGPAFTLARYEGGPFLIDVADAARVLAFMKNDAKMVEFRTACDGSFGHPICDGTSGTNKFTAAVAADCHEVSIHMNTVEFTAPIYRRITNVPPHIGVLTNGPGVKGDMLPKYMASAALDFSGAIGCPPGHPSCPSGNTYQGIIYDRFTALDDLRTLDSSEATALNGGVATAALPNGVLNAQDSSSVYRYQVLWAPHWEIGQALNAAATNGTDCGDVKDAVYQACRDGRKSDGNQFSRSDCRSIRDDAENACNANGGPPPGGTSTIAQVLAAIAANGNYGNANAATKAAMNTGATANFPAVTTPSMTKLNSALSNISFFTDRSGTGLFAECAAVSTFETSMQKGDAASSNKFKWVEPGAANRPSYTAVPRFMYTNGIQINGLPEGTNTNCTDPNYTSGDCIIYPLPGNAFSQMGDFQFTSASAHTIDWIPMKNTGASDWNDNTEFPGGSTASSLRSGALILARSWTAFAGTSDARAVTGVPSWQYETDSSKKNGWTFFSLMQKDNDPNKAMILYLGGHEFADSPAGTRIALNTLLNLGSDPIYADRSLTAPVAFDDVNGTIGAGTRALIFSSTYKAVSGIIPSGAEVYNPATGSQWTFPYIRGDLRAHSLDGSGALAVGESALNAGELWSATAKLPLPDQRNIFTYIGGRLVNTPDPTVCLNTPSCTADTGAYVAPNGVLQASWKPVNIGPNSVVTPTGSSVSGCLDIVAQGNLTDATDGTTKYGFKPGTDGVCDLQQLMQYTQLNPDSSGNMQSADITNLATDLTNVKHMLAMVRGHCYATAGKADGTGTPNYTPANGDCNSTKQGNVGRIGGLVRSTPAVVPPSPNIPANPSANPRPTVAYVGGYDGMIHAFYVSGGTGYKAPAQTMHYPNPPATTAFAVAPNVSGGWAPPASGTELWAFMPSSQLAFLSHNAAAVDASMLVQDVFADFVGSGKREWHTVLVGSAGADSRELFALDITDPLSPVLLWDIVGSTRRTGASTPRMAAVTDIADNVDPSGLTTHFSVNKWDGDNLSTIYKLAPASDPGRSLIKAYDYSDLGGTSALSLGLLRVGLNPVYAAFVATSSSALSTTPTKGLAVFAIDVATGQKIWEWQREFLTSDTTRPHDNYTPRGVTLYYGAEGATTVLVGDFDGRLWELDAATGTNRNYQATNCTGDCNFPAFDTHSTVANPQPITSNISLAKLPATGVTGDFTGFGGQTMLLFGTAGASAVPSTVTGSVYSLLLGSVYRKPLASCTSCSSTVNTTTWASITDVVNDARSNGTLQSVSTWPKALPTGERVFGLITVAGTTAFVPTVTGQVAVEDLMNIDPNSVGKTYTLDLANVTASAITNANAIAGFNKANFGGVAVYTWPVSGGNVKQSVVGAEISKIARFDTALHASGTGAMDAKSTLKTNTGETGVGYRLLNWFRKFAK